MNQFNHQEKIFKKVQKAEHNLFKNSSSSSRTQGSDLTKKLAEAIFNADITIYPKYKLIDAGGTILIETSAGEFKSLGLHHMSEEGVLCNDLETFIKWEDFSK
jgi:hypothetical protein